MRIRKYLLLFCLIGVSFFGACNFPSAPAPFITQTPKAPALASSTPTATLTALPTPTFTLFYDSTATPIQPTPTLTLFYQATITSTPSWTDCPLMITVNDTKAGDILHVLRCEDDLEYDLGPFAKGVYAVGPNHQFIVYVSETGFVYAAKIGEKYLSVVADLIKERFFTAINQRALPKFSISFAGAAPYYKLVLREEKFKQKNIYRLPARIQE